MERLLQYFTPEKYRLHLKIDKNLKTLVGHVEIEGISHSDTIKLHSVGNIIDNSNLTFTCQNGLITFQNAPEGPTKIALDYHRTLDFSLEGAYLSSFKGENTEGVLVTTQFESHYARQCFPCIDEPAAKAVFELTLETPDDGDTVLSNTEIKSQEKQGTNLVTTFEPTPRMSTYLLAFVVAPLKKLETTTKNGVKITSYCTPNQNAELLRLPNEYAKNSLEFYDDLFGLPYPLKKLDLVAIPDFEAGAMENWGLITFRESCFLASENSALSTKKASAITISHEISHQWFGNLVTMDWWDDLWLNESFATVMEYYSIDHLYPSWHVFEDFFTRDCVAALRRDALPGVQAVFQPVEDPAEIAVLFDASIVYAKGARLVLMLMRLMGEKNFFSGISEYLKSRAYKNATHDDLWSFLQPHAKFSVKKFMDAWISQPGYPVLTDGTEARFLLSPAEDHSVWPLPRVTDDLSGHYIINLSGPEFADALDNFENLSMEQKLRLLLDRELLAKTPLVSSSSLLLPLLKFRSDSSAAIWDLLSLIVADLKLFFTENTPEEATFKSFIYNIISDKLEKLGLEIKPTDTENEINLRNTLLSLALYSENRELLEKIANLPVTPENRFFVYAAQLKADESLFDSFLKQYQTSSDPELKDDLLSVISLARSPKNVEKLMELLDNHEIVKPQDHLSLFVFLRRNYKTREKSLDWLTENWESVAKIAGEKTLEDYPRYTASTIKTEEEAEKFRTFFEKYENSPLLSRAISVAKSEIASRLALIAEDRAAVVKKVQKLSENL
ncbi:M1 family metallopeptidase [Candidatus Saccharibacteria bacterium]|nr:M1 family metallopeptidase [Candidatus Saccharibacteria bacterium]